MKKVKTSELVGVQLDWAVAKCANISVSVSKTSERIILFLHPLGSGKWCPSRRWDQGGPIIEHEGISWHCGNKSSWHAYAYGSAETVRGSAPLIAAMRCYVASTLGDVVEIPEEL